MAISNIQVASNADGLSCSLIIDQASGNNRKVVASVHQDRTPSTITAPTLNGVTGTLVATVLEAGGALKCMLYEWNDSGANSIASMPAAAGTYTLATTGTGVEIQITGISCSGAKQTACADPRTDSGTNANDPSFTLTADAGSLAIIALMDANGAQTLTNGAGQTDILAPTTCGGALGGSSYDSADLTVSYTRSTSNAWACCAAAIEPAASGSLSLTSVDSDNEIYSLQPDVNVIGAALSAGQTFTLKGVACTVLSASSSTSVKITLPNFYTNNIKLGSKAEFKVID